MREAVKYIAFDTNAVYRDYLLSSERIIALKRYVKLTHSKLLIPSVLKGEMFKQYRSEWNLAVSELDKINKKFNNLVDVRHHESQAMDMFNEAWGHFISETQAIEIDAARLDLSKLIERSLAEQKPFGVHSKGFRDALLWCSLMDFLKAQDDSHDFVFISNNSDDFGKLTLFPNLNEEVVETNRNGIYYPHLPAFLTDSANATAINDEWIEEVFKPSVDDQIRELIDQSSEQVYDDAIDALYDIDALLYERVLDWDSIAEQTILLDEVNVREYYIYAEDETSYFMQFEVEAGLTTSLALPTDADYDGYSYENCEVPLSRNMVLRAKVNKENKQALLISKGE